VGWADWVPAHGLGSRNKITGVIYLLSDLNCFRSYSEALETLISLLA